MMTFIRIRAAVLLFNVGSFAKARAHGVLVQDGLSKGEDVRLVASSLKRKQPQRGRIGRNRPRNPRRQGEGRDGDGGETGFKVNWEGGGG